MKTKTYFFKLNHFWTSTIRIYLEKAKREESKILHNKFRIVYEKHDFL